MHISHISRKTSQIHPPLDKTLQKGDVTMLYYTLPTHLWIFRPIRGENFQLWYSGHLSSRLAEIGHNATKQRGFPYTWKKAKLKPAQ